MLILTEKSSVAKAFAEALGVPRKDNCWENSDYCIVNAVGHLLEFFSPEDYDPTLKKWTLDSLPVIPEKIKFKAVEKTKAQLKTVKECFNRRKNDPLLLATDAEREGELIGAEILDYVGFTAHKNARRFWVSEALTPDVIITGIKNAKPLLEYVSYRIQGFARQQADWLIGMNITRLLTLKSGKLMHFGRVQTAILGAVYERDKSIADFTPQHYIEVRAILETDTNKERCFSVKLANPDNKEFPARFEKNSKLLSEIESKKDSFKSGTITEIKKEKKTELPPLLFNLTALQKEAHKRFSYSPEQTLEYAQALYEKHKCLSYPRTPSRVMGDENVALVKGIYEKLTSHYKDTCWEISMSGADPSLINSGNKRLFNSSDLQDHHALIPLLPLPGKPAGDGIGSACDCSREEINIYTLVFDQFFTTLKPPHIYNSVYIDVDISGCLFIGSVIELLQSGWKNPDDYDDEEREGKDSPKDYSGLEKNKTYPLSDICFEKNKTKPKKHFTFTSLLQLMENPRNEENKRLTGLGTPATRGSILQKLVDRKYVLLKNKNILVSDDGKFLIENIFNNNKLAAFISIPETTRWEEQLQENIEAFIDDIKNFVRQTIKNSDISAYQHDNTSLGKCPLCGGAVLTGKKNYYCENYRSLKPCNFSIGFEILKAAVTASDMQALLAGKKTKVKKCSSSRTGKVFYAAFYLSKDNILFDFKDK